MHKGVRDMGKSFQQFVPPPQPEFRHNMCREQGCVLGQKTPKKRLRVRTSPNPTYTPSFTSNTFFRTLHTLPTHFQHLCRDACPCFSVRQRSNKGICQHRNTAKNNGLGTKRQHGSYHFPPTHHIHSSSSVSSIHPTLEPSLTSTPSLRIPSPPKPSFQHKHRRPTGVKRCGKAFDELLFQFYSVFIGCND